MQNSSCSSLSSSVCTCSGSSFTLRAGGRERLTSLLPLCRASGLCELCPGGPFTAPKGAAQVLSVPGSQEAGAVGSQGRPGLPYQPTGSGLELS